MEIIIKEEIVSNTNSRKLEVEENPISIPEAAARLGISPSTLRRWVFERRFTFIRVSSRAIRFRISDIENFLTARLVQPVDNKNDSRPA